MRLFRQCHCAVKLFLHLQSKATREGLNTCGPAKNISSLRPSLTVLAWFDQSNIMNGKILLKRSRGIEVKMKSETLADSLLSRFT